MHESIRHLLAYAFASALALSLAGCGGGGGSSSSSNGDGSANDCAPQDTSKWRLLSYQSQDADGDGYRLNMAGQVCSGAQLPFGYFSDAVDATSVDCDDTSGSVWRFLAFGSRDLDSDGYFAAVEGQVCSGTALSPTYRVVPAEPARADCEDTDAQRWRFVSTYQDADADGVGSGSYAVTCVGSQPPSGVSFLGYDPNDDANDPAASAVTNFDISPALLVTP